MAYTITVRMASAFLRGRTDLVVQPVSTNMLAMSHDIHTVSDLYSEKWVLELGRHFDSYAFASSLPGTPSSLVSVYPPFTKLLTKLRAGDVTGCLGEGFTVLALTRILGVSYWHIAHIRPV